MKPERRHDSTVGTLLHISEVQTHLQTVIRNLLHRAAEHDKSKLIEPEKSVFDEYIPRLRELTYGSIEYHPSSTKVPNLNNHQLFVTNT